MAREKINVVRLVLRIDCSEWATLKRACLERAVINDFSFGALSNKIVRLNLK